MDLGLDAGPNVGTGEIRPRVVGRRRRSVEEPEPVNFPFLMVTGRPDGKITELEHPAAGVALSTAWKEIFTPPGEPLAVSPGLRVPRPERTGQLRVSGGRDYRSDAGSTPTPPAALLA